MVSLPELIAHTEGRSQPDGCGTVAFPTLKQLSTSDVTDIWNIVFKRVYQLLLLAKPPAVSITGLGTLCIQKWQAPGDGKTLTFQRPLFLLDDAVAQTRNFRSPTIHVPDDTERVVLNCETIRLHLPHSQQTVQGCLLETLQYFYHVLTSGEDADFTLKDIGTLAIRGQCVTMTFCEDFLLCLNKSPDMVQKLISRRWVVLDKETALLPSHAGRVHLLPEFEIKEVPQLATKPLPEDKLLERKESVLHKLHSLRRTLISVMTETDEDEEPVGSLLPQIPGTEGRQDKGSPGFSAVASYPEDDPDNVSAWIQERKEFLSQLDSAGDIEKWLRNKSSQSRLEERVWKRIRSRRADRRAEGKSAVTDSLADAPASSQPQKDTAPLCIPYPQALVTLHNLLHRRKTNLVNVFKKGGMEGRHIKKADFIEIIKQTNVPISEKDLEDVIVFLTAPTRGKYTTMEKLVECQKEWLEMKKKEARETRGGAQTQPHAATRKTATSPPSAGSRDEGMDPTKPRVKLTPLEVTPVHAEPGQGPQTDHEEKYIPKPPGDGTPKPITRRKMKKDKDRPIIWEEEARLGRSGEITVEEHCMPSTTGSDTGALIDQYRNTVAVSYLNSSKLCRERDIPLTDSVLQKGLLHPGDKIIRKGQYLRRIRQPGGYYNTGLDDVSSLLSMSRSRSAAGDLGKDGKTKRASEEFCLYDSRQRSQKREKVERSYNMFWPGHLLDKLRLCIPEEKANRAHPLFSCVRPTRPVYNIK